MRPVHAGYQQAAVSQLGGCSFHCPVPERPVKIDQHVHAPYGVKFAVKLRPYSLLHEPEIAAFKLEYRVLLYRDTSNLPGLVFA